MKHQYESEILFNLMERDGFNIPSSVPPYESEIKAYLINQVKQAYPKLTDYEAEWLLYNYTKHLPADFPISSATNVTKATFENVVPFAYQNVVLKGQTLGRTLANLSSLKGEITIAPNSTKFSDTLLKKTTIYTVSFNCSSVPSTGTIEVRQVVGGNAVKMENISVVLGYNQFIITSSSSGAERIRFKNDSTSTTDFVFNNLLIIEGDYTNVDIPYFEGIQSVKMPVLTTTGKNLFDGELEIGGLSNVNGLPVDNQPDRCRSINYIKVNSSTGYVISLSHSGIVEIREFDKDYNLISWASLPSHNKFTTTNQTKYLKFIIINKNVDNLVQLEEGTTATPYEPYKANILSTPTDLELRGIGNVQDTLDCLTGEVTQRVKERLLNGEERWEISNTSSVFVDVSRFKLRLTDAKITNAKLISDKFEYNNTSLINDEICYFGGDYTLYVNIHKNKLSEDSIIGFKTWLSINPLTIQYELGEPLIKTVDLKTVNESGESVHFMPLEGTMHVQSSGEPIQPTFDMSVPVEATTQNLASFIDLEMEE